MAAISVHAFCMADEASLFSLKFELLHDWWGQTGCQVVVYTRLDATILLTSTAKFTDKICLILGFAPNPSINSQPTR